jgi:hypothetical protein
MVTMTATGAFPDILGSCNDLPRADNLRRPLTEGLSGLRAVKISTQMPIVYAGTF